MSLFRISMVLGEFMKYDPLFDMSLFRIFMVLGEFMKYDPFLEYP